MGGSGTREYGRSVTLLRRWASVMPLLFGARCSRAFVTAPSRSQGKGKHAQKENEGNSVQHFVISCYEFSQFNTAHCLGVCHDQATSRDRWGGGSSSLAATSSSSSIADNGDDDEDDDKEEEEEEEAEELAASAKKSFREDDAESWEKSPAEKARRIFEWWKIRVPVFKYWPTALRLIVLVQPSSAFVERAFSQIKLIIEQIGVSGLEETLEARALVRCNRD